MTLEVVTIVSGEKMYHSLPECDRFNIDAQAGVLEAQKLTQEVPQMVQTRRYFNLGLVHDFGFNHD